MVRSVAHLQSGLTRLAFYGCRCSRLRAVVDLENQRATLTDGSNAIGMFPGSALVLIQPFTTDPQRWPAVPKPAETERPAQNRRRGLAQPIEPSATPRPRRRDAVGAGNALDHRSWREHTLSPAPDGWRPAIVANNLMRSIVTSITLSSKQYLEPGPDLDETADVARDDWCGVFGDASYATGSQASTIGP
jgi:hypothetical protein